MALKTTEIMSNRQVPRIRALSSAAHRVAFPRLLVPGLLAMALLVANGSTAAAEATVVLGVSGAGPVELHDELSEILVDVVNINPALELTEHLDMTLQDALELLAYDEITPVFLVDLTLSLEADRLLFAVITEAEGQYNAEVTYFDAILGEILVSASYPFSTPEDREQTTHRLHAEIGNQAIVEFIADRAGVEVTVDDSTLGEAPVVSYGLTPGPHSVTASCSDCEVLTRQITLSAGQYLREEVTPMPLSAYVTGEQPGEGGGRSYVLPSVTLGTGVALLGAGLAFGLMTQSTQDDFDVAASIEEAEDLADQGETYAMLTNVFLIGGGAVTVAGIVLFFVGGGPDEEQPEQARGEGAAARFSGWAAGSSGGVRVDWPF